MQLQTFDEAGALHLKQQRDRVRRAGIVIGAGLLLGASLMTSPAQAHEFGGNGGYDAPNHGAFAAVGPPGAPEQTINGAIVTFTQPGIEHFDVPQNCGSGIQATVYPACSNYGANARPMQIVAYEPASARNGGYFIGTGVVAGCANSRCTGIGTNGAPYKRWYADGKDQRGAFSDLAGRPIISVGTSHSIQLQREIVNGTAVWSFWLNGQLQRRDSGNGNSILYGGLLVGTESTQNYTANLSKYWPGWRDVRRKYPNGSYFNVGNNFGLSQRHAGCYSSVAGGTVTHSGRC